MPNTFYVRTADKQQYVEAKFPTDVHALGLMAICYQEPGRHANFNRTLKYADQGYA